MNHHSARYLASCLAGVLLAAATGCGPGVETAPVQGRVLYNGEPLQFGSVMFQPPTGQPARAIIQSDGSFTLETSGLGSGAVVGKNRVRVTCFEAQDPKTAAGSFGEGLGQSLIPAKYNSYETSGLEATVEPGQIDPLTIELTDKS